jgi:hypothetical protein
MNNITELISFVLESSTNEPPIRRIKILKGLSEVIGNPDDQRFLASVIKQLSDAESRFREFHFIFNQKITKGNTRE